MKRRREAWRRAGGGGGRSGEERGEGAYKYKSRVLNDFVLE